MILDEMHILSKMLPRDKQRAETGDLVLEGNQHCDVVVEPAQLSGSIAAIPSKSYAQRILIAAALASSFGRPPEIQLNYVSDDVKACITALQSLYAAKRDLEVVGSTSRSINCGESGTVARLLLPVATALVWQGTLTGEGSLLARPFETLCTSLEQGGKLRFDQYALPLSWEGRLQPGAYHLPGDESSQYVSALLFALPLLSASSTITLTSPLESAGYVDVTLDVLQQFGISSDYNAVTCTYTVDPQQYRSPGSISVEGDWSNAAFWLAAGIEVTGLKSDSLQRDRNFLQVKDQARIDATDIPDLVPILSVYAALRKGITCIHGIERLRIKESDRTKTTLAMLQALGCKAELRSGSQSDGSEELIIQGTTTIPGGGTVDGANDHRIVMAAAIAASFAKSPVTITGAQAVAKTYAHFFDDFQDLGGKVHVI